MQLAETFRKCPHVLCSLSTCWWIPPRVRQELYSIHLFKHTARKNTPSLPSRDNDNSFLPSISMGQILSEVHASRSAAIWEAGCLRIKSKSHFCLCPPPQLPSGDDPWNPAISTNTSLVWATAASALECPKPFPWKDQQHRSHSRRETMTKNTSSNMELQLCISIFKEARIRAVSRQEGSH